MKSNHLSLILAAVAVSSLAQTVDKDEQSDTVVPVRYENRVATQYICEPVTTPNEAVPFYVSIIF